MNATRSRWLLLVNLALSFYCVGAVWLVQVTCYPLWAYVGSAEFEAYHIFWWHSIWGVILGPAGLVFLGALAMLRWRPAAVSLRMVWLGVALQVALYALTAIWWGRWMAELVQVTGPVYGPLFHRLLVTHWLRVALITAYGLLMFRMAALSFLPKSQSAGHVAPQPQPTESPTPASP
jgi:hypothetical protein